MAVKQQQATTAADFLPERKTLESLSRAAQDCRGCPLYENATQVVFGSGPADAQVVFVGEQPGDQEDLQGLPFVGPAGRLLRQSLADVELDAGRAYFTNAVKHFKWEPRGKRRVHAKPSAREVAACHPWAEAELEALRPRLIVCLGATAAQSLLGRSFRLTQSHGTFQDSTFGIPILATYHPSAILRAPHATRQAMKKLFLKDLQVAVRFLAKK